MTLGWTMLCCSFRNKKMQFNLYLVILCSGFFVGINCFSEFESEEEHLENGFCLFKEVWVSQICDCLKSYSTESTNKNWSLSMYSKQVVENEEVSYDDVETYMGRCRGAYFRRCINYRSVQKTRLEPRMKEQVNEIRKCCDGFVAEDQSCLPFCRNNCNNGICSAPNTCTCKEGYVLEANSTHK